MIRWHSRLVRGPIPVVLTVLLCCAVCCCSSGAESADAGVTDASVEMDAASLRDSSGPDAAADSGICMFVSELEERIELIEGSSFLEDIYASTVLVHEGVYHMWYSGWRKSEHYPYDRIFHATSSNGLDWDAPDEPAFDIDAAVADPSVVFQESRQRFIMVFSYIRDPEKWHGLEPENWELDEDENYLHVWTAESPDAENWYGFRELVGRDNGHDDTAAWAPGILLVDDETAQLYYNNDPNFMVHPEHGYLVLRTTVDLSGDAEMVATEAVVSDGVLRANVDVSVHESGWLMLYNRIIADPVRRYSIGAMVSQNGAEWNETDASVWRPDGTQDIDIATPHLFMPPDCPGEVWVFVGEGDQNMLTSSVCVWRYRGCL